MCRMITVPLGLSGRLLVSPFVRMATGMNKLSEYNRELGMYTHGHGWGSVLAGKSEDQTTRSSKPCWDEGELLGLQDQDVLMLHARMASQGAINLDNVHPFRALVHGTVWNFCHNGTVNQPLVMPQKLSKADCTDSETVFHQLLPFLEMGQIIEGFRRVYSAIHDFTSLNTLLLGPDALWVVCLYTEMPEYYTLHLTQTERGPVISSEPIHELGSQWHTLSNRQILSIDRASGVIQSFELSLRI